MVKQNLKIKAEWILSKFSSGEIQCRASVPTPFKLGREPSSPIILRDRYVEGTGIPASTIHRFQTGEFHMGEISIRKLASFYERYMYHRLRAAGGNTRDSRKNCRLSPSDIKPIFRNYARWVRAIQSNNRQNNHPVRPEYIQWGMAHSFHTYNDWENISKFSGLKKAPKKRPPKNKRHRKYEH